MKSPAFQFYPNDWLSSRAVRLMDDQQRGWYWQLIVESWCSDPQCSLPEDMHQLYILSGASDEANWNARSDLVLSQFTKRNGFLWHDRLLEEYAKQQFHKEKSALGGKKSGMARRLQRRKDMETIKDKHVGTINPPSIQVEPKTKEPMVSIEPKSNLSLSTSSSISSSSSNMNIGRTFIPPKASEVTEYAKSIGFTLDGEYFVDKYTANGWMVGKSRMKDWKATVRTWKKNNFQSNGNVSNTKKPHSIADHLAHLSKENAA